MLVIILYVSEFSFYIDYVEMLLVRLMLPLQLRRFFAIMISVTGQFVAWTFRRRRTFRRTDIMSHGDFVTRFLRMDTIVWMHR